MSDLAATQCCNNDCGCSTRNNGCSCSWIWIIILLELFGGCGGSNWFGMNRSSDNDDCCWIIILLLFFCGGCGFGNNSCC